MNAQLRPCPFCGGVKVTCHHRRKSRFSAGFSCTCSTCGIRQSVRLHATTEAAFAAWNERAALAAPKEAGDQRQEGADICDEVMRHGGRCPECKQTLHASPPPEAAAAVGDRKRFEHWAGSQGLRLAVRDRAPIDSGRHGQYCADDTQLAWEAYRAALASPTGVDEGQS